jgi:hypothetical protein
MKLKELFSSLAVHNYNVEIYFIDEHLNATFGFKINGIDLINHFEVDSDLCMDIVDEITNGFINALFQADTIEGDISYFLQQDLSCIKNGKYFSSVEESYSVWIEDNETEFYLKNTELPFDSIFISKKLDSFEIDEEKELKKALTKQQYDKFITFYKELLSVFQQMEIELQFEEYYETGLICSILSMDGSYTERTEFTLLDSSEVDFSKDKLKTMLLKCFKLDPLMVSQILNEY